MEKKSILDILAQKNEFPIIFIGSGIPRRYLVKYPGWEELLEEFWTKIGKENFYGELGKIRSKVSDQDKVDAEFLANIEIASQIEKIYDEKFYSGEINVDGLTQKEAYREGISPFKKQLSNRFSKYQVKESMEKELPKFQQMLLRAQMILTTNYDLFIENQYNDQSQLPVKVYVGQQGFFKQTFGFAELYKIHGSSSEPQSLIISKEDYSKYDKNSVLISAKVISMLLNSPIIFLGYSLTDRNVRNLIKSFTSALSDVEREELEKRLIVIEWKQGSDKIEEEIINDIDLGCRLTVIKTDNYAYIYDQIAKINQGVAPVEVRRYQSVIRNLIIERGKTGTLKSLLISPSDLDQIEGDRAKENLVVAIGDNTVIFKMPNIVDYIYDYIDDHIEQNEEIMLRFIASQNSNILPFWKYLSREKIANSSLSPREKDKLNMRLQDFADADAQKQHLTYHETYKSIEEIKKMKFKKYHEIIVVAYNIDGLESLDVKQYILDELTEIKRRNEITVATELRRLALLYDFKYLKE